ncbi:tetratricopeptide repeat protein [Thiohalorhabdus sp.]|uniref:tetratricopeptide repeat protein n=1 Tax=Thiohalorhabdus sp. TaxID=3094134 RepID=UPI002FC2C32E
MVPHLWRAAAVAAALVSTPAVAQTDAKTEFDRGVAAYKAEEYGQAVGHFQAARAAGLSSPALLHNLGSSYYRLGRYDKAEAAFRELAKDPANRGIAHYNLGLIALARDNPERARGQFQTAKESTHNDGLRRLTDEQLAELGDDQSPSRFYALLSASLGYNDNVTLSPDDTAASTDTDDVFLEYLAAGTFQATGNPSNGLQLKASLLGLDYTDVDRFDQTYLRAGPEWDRRLGRWDTDLAAYTDFIYLDGSLFESILTGEAEGRRELGPNTTLRLRYRFSHIEGDPPYDYLTGSRHRTSVEGRYRARVDIRLGYKLEYNDREDRSTAATFTSVSPTRHEVFLEAAYPAGAWEAQAKAEYRRSRYHDANANDAGLDRVREDDRIRLEASLTRKLPWDLRAFAEYQHTVNDSNIDSGNPNNYDYTATVYQFGLERYF